MVSPGQTVAQNTTDVELISDAVRGVPMGAFVNRLADALNLQQARTMAGTVDQIRDDLHARTRQSLVLAQSPDEAGTPVQTHAHTHTHVTHT